MKSLRALLLSLSLLNAHAFAHDLGGGEAHPHYDRSIKPPGADGAPVWFLAQAGTRNTPQVAPAQAKRPAQAAAFEKFAPAVTLRWDERYLYVEDNGMPAHNMMVGITAWQQQVPLPQNYKGANAWQIPLVPVPAKEPASIKNRFLRGAIALAANGIPIFNPQNNRGEVSQEIGELDEWGGHCGRADDYHYHAAPLHLQQVLGKSLPIAYALDGYAIYGLTEPDGAAPAGLDSFNGHSTSALGYHYHASTKYPYVNGGFHGEVVEREQQVDPQPRAQPVREALKALRGAKITGFEATGANRYKLSYEVSGDKRAVLYAINADGSVAFEFQNGREGSTKNTYTPRKRGAGQGGPRPEAEPPARESGGAPPREDNGGPPQREPRSDAPRRGGADDRRGGPREQARGGESGSRIGMDAMKKPSKTFVLTSPEIGKDSKLPPDYTGDGSGATLPLVWQGAPANTRSYALVMDHLAPGDTVKSYWTMWAIPASTTSLPKNVSGVGKVGTSFKGALGYEAPHSQGPGEKAYVITVYALSAEPQLTQSPREVSRDVLLEALKDKVLASASMNVVYSSQGASGAAPEGRRPREGAAPGRSEGAAPAERPRREEPPPPREEERQGAPATRGAAPAPRLSAAEPAPVNDRRANAGAESGAKPDGKGLVKPTMADTVHINVYADNWFVLFINGELVAVDSIKFTPHNVVSLDVLPEYPMTIAIMAKDNADPKTGLEYGDHIGDGGFIIKFADGTVSNAAWKAKCFFKGPLNRDAANPKVEHTPIPDQWWTAGFDDRQWPNAVEYSEQRVNPKQPYFDADFGGAKFIWSADLDLDNTVIFRTKVEKPGWTKRWNTKPDLDVTGAPFK